MSTTYAIRHTLKKTRKECISDTVSFPPSKFIKQNISSTDSIVHDARALVHALQNPSPDIPLVTLGINVFGKTIYPAEPSRVPIKEAYLN